MEIFFVAAIALYSARDLHGKGHPSLSLRDNSPSRGEIGVSLFIVIYQKFMPNAE